MPVLSPDGPNLPVKILQAHEEGRLVLFCGAGVSVQAGMPLFGALVKFVQDRVPLPSTDALKEALGGGQYDRALNLIEEQSVAGAMRRAVMERLRQPADLTTPDDPRVSFHRDLLQIATTKEGVRLVTTNFDLLFSVARPGLPVD